VRTTLTTNKHFDRSPPVITEPNLLEAEFSTGMWEVDERRLRLSPVPILDQLNLSSNDEFRSVRSIATVGLEGQQTSSKATSVTTGVFVMKAGAHLLVATMSN
jgi:hypothetical protein